MTTLPLFERSEAILAVLDGATERDRVLLVKLTAAGMDDRIELRQQTFGDGVGWFTQATIPLQSDQVSAMCDTLKANASQAAVPTPQRAARLHAAREMGLGLVH